MVSKSDVVGVRLGEIERCMFELERLRWAYKRWPAEAWGILVGELDWLEELHHLLYV